MNAAATMERSGFTEKMLAVLAVVLFWLIPFSPLLCIVALLKTKHVNGWPRTTSVVASVLCVLYVTFFGLQVFVRYLSLG